MQFKSYNRVYYTHATGCIMNGFASERGEHQATRHATKVELYECTHKTRDLAMLTHHKVCQGGSAMVATNDEQERMVRHVWREGWDATC
eukprot:m.18318 g.18318  ORF g.18318 m.18318 type:complete len:89 (+) comp7797_c0_seq1:923-1189(+)